MFRTTLVTIALMLTVARCESNFNCDKTFKADEDPQRVCFIPECVRAIQNHIKEEFNAAFTYLAMGSYFAQESVNRPGLAQFLLSAASEERSHAILMMDYLNKRGIKLFSKNANIDYNFEAQSNDTDNKINLLSGNIEYKDILTYALNMEIKVTQFIYDVIETCEADFHGAHEFTNSLLDEQHNGVRQLQGAIKVFANLADGAISDALKNFAEYTFDMMLVKGELMATH